MAGRMLRVRTLLEILKNPALLVSPVAVVPYLAWRGRVTLLVGREKSGKSTLIAAGMAAASRADAFLGSPTQETLSLWYSADREPLGDLARRFVRFDAIPTHIRILDQPLALADFRECAMSYSPQLLVVDTLASAVAGLVRDAAGSAEWPVIMAMFTALARDMDCAVVLLHHAAKSGEGYRDSTAIGAGVDEILTIEEIAGAPDARRLKARGRHAHGEITTRLVNHEYQLDVGLPSLDARILDHIEQHPGLSGNMIGKGLGNNRGERREDLLESLRRLAAARQIENRGAGKAPAWYRVVPVVPAHTEPVPASGGSGPLIRGTGNQQQLEPVE
ncbi:MAG TPA: AAA family ATPase [Gemmatimonadales bacterium]